MRPVPTLVITACLLALHAGCASWSERDGGSGSSKGPLAPVRESSKAVILEVQFVQIGVEDVTADEMESLWQWVDEVSFDPASRMAMADNGIRGGRLVQEERFRSRLDSLRGVTGVVDEFLQQAEVASDISHGVDRIPMRIGRRYELPLRQPQEGAHVSLIRVNGETIGRTLQDPQFLLAITPRMGRSLGETHLRIRPEIQHGGSRQRFVTADSALRIDTRRDSWSLEELELNVAAGQGDTLVLAAETPLRGLGEQMFSGHSVTQEHQQLVILIKIAQVPRIEEG